MRRIWRFLPFVQFDLQPGVPVALAQDIGAAGLQPVAVVHDAVMKAASFSGGTRRSIWT